MVEIMYYLMFLACVAVLVMAIFVLLYQREVNISLKRKYDDLKRELNNCFGWEEWTWANNFREYARKVEELIKFKEEIEQLEIIKKALDVQKIEELQERKKLVEREIQKLEK
nr:MAG TPA: cell division protein [Caudoviricetes sp.]